MLTIRFDKLGLRRGDRVLDVGAGFGRHAFEAARRGGRVVALDYAADEVVQTRATVGAMVEAGEITVEDFSRRAAGRRHATPVRRRDVRRRHHVRGARAHPGRRRRDHRDGPRAWRRAARSRRRSRAGSPRRSTGCCPTSTTRRRASAVTCASTPSPSSERSCAPPASTSRAATTRTRCTRRTGGCGASSGHAARSTTSGCNRYKRFLEWDIIERPRSTRIADRLLSPVLGKSVVLYARKPAVTATIATMPAREGSRRMRSSPPRGARGAHG